ncbi:MAG: hypothetical protein PUC41_08690 [Oscillospiraceae bacterium]|nr:hypothetical protein [Oscillospiraceae bacterium]
MMNCKKQIRLCLLPMLAVVLYLLVTALCNHFTLQNLKQAVDAAGTFVTDITSDGEVSDVEGYGAILSSIGYVFGSVLYGVGAFLVVWVPVAIAAVGAFGVLVARLLYAPDGVRMMLFRIQMVLLYLLFGATAAAVLIVVFSVGSIGIMIKMALFALPILAAIACSAVCCFRKPLAG